MAKTKEKIKVKITKSRNWYKVGEVHEVFNYVTFLFFKGEPCFEKGSGVYGIRCSDCEIAEIPKLTMQELFDIVGYEFKISE